MISNDLRFHHIFKFISILYIQYIMLSNFDIIDISKVIKLNINPHIVMKDQLRLLPPKEGNYIINLQSSFEGNGSHWVSLVLNKRFNIYFDSFGELPPTEIIDFSKRCNESKLYYSDKHIQPLRSEFCGWYCLMFLKYIQTNGLNSYQNFIDLFEDFDKSNNDKVLIGLYRKLVPNPKLPVFKKIFKNIIKF